MDTKEHAVNLTLGRAMSKYRTRMARLGELRAFARRYDAIKRSLKTTITAQYKDQQELLDED